MKLKQRWQGLKYWQKGAIIGIVVNYGLIVILGASGINILGPSFFHSILSSYVLLNMFILVLTDVLNLCRWEDCIIYILFTLLIWIPLVGLILGALIGLIIGKVKK